MTAKRLPLIVLPCSADKLSYPSRAIDFYQGKGYLPVLRKKTTLHLGSDYNLAFVSAVYGLVMADEILSPYDLKMTAKQANWLVANKSEPAQAKLLKLNPAKVIACLPKLYLSTFEKLTNSDGLELTVLKPTRGSGIGHQRQFLSVEMDKLY